MQTGLLAFAIVLIAALVAAIAGPHFVDWTAYRPQFERELSRVLGTDVRIVGDLDARLLPSPSLSLHDLALGKMPGGTVAHAERLDIEFHLGPLLRGEWRASRLSLQGADIAVEIGNDGAIAAPGAGAIDLAGLAVDRLQASGRIALRDTRSGKAVTLHDVSFAGELRAASGSLRGEGSARFGERALIYRIGVAPTADHDGTRLRASFESGAGVSGPPLVGEADGTLRLSGTAPAFDGQVSLARPVSLGNGASGTGVTAPWRARAHVKGDTSKLRLDTLEFHYGTEDGGVRLTGLADVALGESPRAEAVLSARQIDLDRLLASDERPETPAGRLGRLARDVALFAPPMPLALSASIDVAQIGGRPVRGIGFDARAGGDGWTIDKLELQAPGATHASLSGKLERRAGNAAFNGALAIDSADIAALATWLRGGAPIFEPGLPVKADARIGIAPERIAIETLTGSFRGARIAGAVILSGAPAADSQASFASAEVSLAADAFDLAALGGMIREAGLERGALPDRVKLDLRLDRAHWRETVAREIVLRGSASHSELVVERLAATDVAGIALDGSGRLDLNQSTGGIVLNARAAQMEQVVRLVAPVSPAVAARLRRAAGGDREVTAALNLGVTKQNSGSQSASLAFDANSETLKARLRMHAPLTDDRLDLLSPSKWPALTVNGEGEVQAASTRALVIMLGLDGVLGAGRGLARLTGTLEGASDKPLRMRAELVGDGAHASLSGTVSAKAGELAANLKLDVPQADIAPLVGATESVPAVLAARAELADGALSLRDLDATIAGTRLRGRLSLGDVFGEPVIEGDVGIERLALGPVLAAIAGAPRGGEIWSKEPFGPGLARGWRGRIAFAALSAEVGGLTSRALRGAVRAEGDVLHFDDLAGQAAGGAWQGRFDMTRTDTLRVGGAFKLDSIEASQWPLIRDAVTSGRLNGEIMFGSAGRSPAALIGSVNGSASVRLSEARLAALNPSVFADTVAIADTMTRIDGVRIAAAVRQSLAAADLAVPDASFNLGLRAGRVHADSVELATPALNVTVNGSYELISGGLDARLRLEARDAPAVSGAGAPVIGVALKGRGGTITRDVDTNALIAWLTVRAVDRETRRLEALEKERAARPPPDAQPSQPAAPAPPAESAPPPSDAGRASPPPAQPVSPEIATPAPITTDAPGASPTASLPQNAPLPPAKPKPRPQAQRAAPKPPPPLPPPIELRPAPGLFR